MRQQCQGQKQDDLVLFCCVFLCYFYVILFWVQKCFPKTFERFWHNDINDLILFAEIQRKYRAVFVVVN